MTQYEHTQVGYSMIWIPAAATVLVAIGASFELSPHREILLVVSIVFLLTIALFYKLTIAIDSKTLRWSFGVGNSSHAARLAIQRLGIKCRGDHIAQRSQARFRHR